MSEFEDRLNQVLSQNNGQQQRNQYRPVNLGQKQPFMGRILPLEQGRFPFVQHQIAWISYTRRDGQVSSMQVELDANDPNDKIAHILQQIIKYNRDYRNNHPEEKNDIIKIAPGRFPLSIRTKEDFLGVPLVKTQGNQYGQAMTQDGRPSIQAYSASHGAMVAVAKLLRPKFPYVYQGNQLFQNDYQFITTGQTFAVDLSFQKDPNGGIGSWNAQVITNFLLPAIQFNYLQKDQNNQYQYVDDIATNVQPLYKSNPQLANNVYNQLSQSFKEQKERIEQSQTNPFANEAPQNQQAQTYNVVDQMGVQQPQGGQTNDPFTQNQIPGTNEAQTTTPFDSATTQAPQSNFKVATPNSPAPQQATPQAAPKQPQRPAQPTTASQASQQTQPTAPQTQTTQPVKKQSGDIDNLLDGSQSLEDFINGGQ